MKFIPATVRVNPLPQFVTEDGESDVMLGTGFGGGGGPGEPPHPAKAATSNKTLRQCQMQTIRLSFRIFSAPRRVISHFTHQEVSRSAKISEPYCYCLSATNDFALFNSGRSECLPSS